MSDFKQELEILINKHCIENKCDMPDFLLAEMICDFIESTGKSIKKNLDWHGCDSICHPKPEKTQEEICKTHKEAGVTCNFCRELKTLKDLWTPAKNCGENTKVIPLSLAKTEAIRIFKNLQGPETIYPLILELFPDKYKGSMAEDMWHETEFRYGLEYGMLAMLFWLMNLKEEDLQ